MSNAIPPITINGVMTINHIFSSGFLKFISKRSAIFATPYPELTDCLHQDEFFSYEKMLMTLLISCYSIYTVETNGSFTNWPIQRFFTSATRKAKIRSFKRDTNRKQENSLWNGWIY